ncbi:MAG: hypothetical protein H0T46_34060 [Deltaproteobacteria bacterium]|nr:hypothetical protein [Deltaproteobacteria bacterium]
MAKTESTAINDLINLVATATPRKPAPDEDLMFQAPPKKKSHAVSIPRMTGTVPPMNGAGEVEPLPRGRSAVGTTQNKIAPQVRVTTAPPSRQVTIPPLGVHEVSDFEVSVETPAAPTLNNKFDLSAASSIGHNLPLSSIGISVPPAPLAPYEPDPEPAIAPRHEETWVGTVQTPKTATTAQWLAKLAPAMGAMIVIGIFVGGYVAFDGQGGKKRTPVVSAPAPVQAAAIVQTDDTAPAPVGVADPEPVKAEEPKAAEPAVAAPTAPPKERPVFADIRLDSKPSGATVTLIDGEKRMFIGTTPIATSVDISRQYDVEFTYSTRPPVVEHLDPTTMTKLAVEIRRAKQVAVVAPTADAPKADAPKVEKAVAKPAAPVGAEPVGQGILMISSKPPCEILIDGKPTGLMTPQRALPLSAGPHKVTLVNPAEKIKKTLSIQITADQPTKVIQDLMAK